MFFSQQGPKGILALAASIAKARAVKLPDLGLMQKCKCSPSGLAFGVELQHRFEAATLLLKVVGLCCQPELRPDQQLRGMGEVLDYDPG